LDISLEEEREQTMVDILTRKYQKLFKHLFTKYANTGIYLKNKKKDTVQRIFQTLININKKPRLL